MIPSDRVMPQVKAVWLDDRWIVTLPDGRQRVCLDRDAAIRVIDREACGSAIRWIGGPDLPVGTGLDFARADRGAGVASRDEGPVPARRPRSQVVASGLAPVVGSVATAGRRPSSA